MLSILPRFVALEMIGDMISLEDELNPQELHKIYIHQYKDVRYAHNYTHTYLISGTKKPQQDLLLQFLCVFVFFSLSLVFAAFFLQTSRASPCCP